MTDRANTPQKVQKYASIMLLLLYRFVNMYVRGTTGTVLDTVHGTLPQGPKSKGKGKDKGKERQG